ncbi:MAG: cation-transporting P-type ATPase, partial [Candidatus Pacebacteria bacterium]|nr:cation-transporting P-type ATPase [Candidatus Paceibacterota bacterium]
MEEQWHTISLAKVFELLTASCKGLSSQEADLRLLQNGKNILPKEKPHSKIKLFLSQFNSPLMYILLTTVVISFFLKHLSDAVFIVVVLFINTTVGFYQENKANNSLAALKKMVKVKAKVLRDNNEKEVDSENLVVGDVVILKMGDKIPGDGRIIESKNLRINEASLTGESKAMKKDCSVKPPQRASLSEQGNMAFMGTIVEEGEGKIILTATGIETEIGKIVSLLKEAKERKTPLQKKILTLSKQTAFFILSLIFIIILIGHFTEKAFSDILVASLALAVSAIPEGLLPAITVILTLGMRRIFKQKGLVRKLIATETLGSVTVICTDKTGTLTEGKMQVSYILTSTKELFSSGFKAFLAQKDLNGAESHILALKIAALVNEAFVENPDQVLEKWVVRGRPTDQALLVAGMQAGLHKKELEVQYPILDRINFESGAKYAATYHKLNSKKTILYAIGAPEIIIEHSNFLDVDGKAKKLNSAELNKLLGKVEALTKKGLRVLACSYKQYPHSAQYKNLAELKEKMILVGFIAIKDPLRADAQESIETAKKAGIRTLVITGDHKLTARAIALEVGLVAEKENILEGKEIDELSDDSLKQKVETVSIYARVSPSHKLRIVRALQDNGEVVAMVGDGVNDAPALKVADIGISLGSGTDVAKEVADLVLLDDNFKTIVKAVEQGRIVFGNIRKVFTYLVADDFSELFLFLGCMIMGFPLPLLPAQILWINLVEDGFPDIALTCEQETKGIMDEPPRSPQEPILNKPLKIWMTAIFFITGLAAFLSFLLIWKLTGDLLKTRTIVFALMCFDSLVFAFSVRSFKRAIIRRDIFSNRYLVFGVLLGLFLLVGAVYFPPLQKLLVTQALSALEWLMVLGISL